MKDRHAFRTTGSHSDPPSGRVLQRKCSCGQHTVAGGECSDCEKKKGVLQHEPLNDQTSTEPSPVVRDVLNSPGAPLDPTTRAFMEPRFGHDFSSMSTHSEGSSPMPSGITIGAPHDHFEREADVISENVLTRSIQNTGPAFDFRGVRIHADPRAADSARNLNALAYTVGQHIVFGDRQYQPQSVAGRKLLAHELTHVVQQTAEHAPAVIARQPAPAPPPPGWSDATGLNKFVTTVDDQGKMQQGKLTTTGVWRVPIEGLTEGLQKGVQDTAIESSEKRAIALIPNTGAPAPAKSDAKTPISIDVLLHFHGHGIGYRELQTGQKDSGKILQPGEVRDVALYQMEQQLLSHIKSTNHFVIAILPQGSAKSKFGDLSAKSDDFLKAVFNKLTAYLPKNAVPGRVILSAHSGGGPTAMEIANQRLKAGMPTNVLLFDAINFGCAERKPKLKDGKPVMDKENKPVTECVKCTSNEADNVKDWITNRIKTDVNNLSGKDASQDVSDLQKNGARFRGVTSNSLTSKDTCGYGFWYNEVKTHIEKTIKKLRVDSAISDQLSKNYKVEEAAGLQGLTGMERHERMISDGNLEAVLKD